MATEVVLTANYEYLYDMLKRLALRYVRYGYDLDDLMQEACTAFLLAHIGFDRELGSYRGWVYTKVSMRLMEYHRKQTQIRQIKGKEVDVQDWWNQFWLVDFLDELGDDAKVVTKIILESPMELRLALKSRVRKTWYAKKEPNPRDVRGALSEVLSDIGWTKQRILDSFTEIRRALR